VVVRSETAIRELRDRVEEMLVHKEILQLAVTALTYQDSNKNSSKNNNKNSLLVKNNETLYQLGRLSLEITKDTLNWVLTEQDSFLNKFVQCVDRYKTPEIEQNDLFLRN
jgi:hypothetical protein